MKCTIGLLNMEPKNLTNRFLVVSLSFSGTLRIRFLLLCGFRELCGLNSSSAAETAAIQRVGAVAMFRRFLKASAFP